MLVYQRVTYVLVVVHCHLVEWDCPEEGANMRSLTEHSVYSWTKSTVSPKLCVATGLDQVGLPDTECWVEGLNNCCLLQPTWNKNPGKLGLLSWHPSKPPRYPIYPRKKKGRCSSPKQQIPHLQYILPEMLWHCFCHLIWTAVHVLNIAHTHHKQHVGTVSPNIGCVYSINIYIYTQKQHK